LTEEEEIYLSNLFQIKVIPTYLIYDTSGQLKNRFDGYPGNEKMQEVIEKLLP